MMGIKRTIPLVSVACVALLGCNKAEKPADDGLVPAAISGPGELGHTPFSGRAHANADAGATAANREGKVAETMNAGGHTSGMARAQKEATISW